MRIRKRLNGAGSVASNLPTQACLTSSSLVVNGNIFRTLPRTITYASLSMHVELTSLSMYVEQLCIAFDDADDQCIALNAFVTTESLSKLVVLLL